MSEVTNQDIKDLIIALDKKSDDRLGAIKRVDNEELVNWDFFIIIGAAIVEIMAIILFP